MSGVILTKYTFQQQLTSQLTKFILNKFKRSTFIQSPVHVKRSFPKIIVEFLLANAAGDEGLGALHQMLVSSFEAHRLDRGIAFSIIESLNTVKEIEDWLQVSFEALVPLLKDVCLLPELNFDEECFRYIRANMPIVFLGETARDACKTWIDANYSCIDVRVESSSIRSLRRMDSLARCFALKAELSVCTSVVIDTSTVPANLIVAVNVGSDGLQEKIVRQITQRVTTIREHVQSFLDGDVHDYDTHANKLTDSLCKEGSHIPKEIIRQAVRKILHVVCVDHDTWDNGEKSAFAPDVGFTILLAESTPFGIKMASYHITPRGCIKSLDDLPNIAHIRPGALHISGIHAEQLQAWRLKLLTSGTLRIQVGLSRLCCHTCFHALKRLPNVDIIVRGGHGQRYVNVPDIFAPPETRPRTPPTRQTVTHAWNSPKDSPPQARIHRAGTMEGGRARRLLLFCPLRDETQERGSCGSPYGVGPAGSFGSSFASLLDVVGSPISTTRGDAVSLSGDDAAASSIPGVP